jgi:hypothetical protein
VADEGITNYPGDDDLDLPSDMSISPTAAGDGNYTFKQWLRRVTGFVRAIYDDFVNVHQPDTDAHHAQLHGLSSVADHSITEDLDMGGFKVTGIADGTGDTDAVNKGQLDALNSRPATVRAASTVDLTLFGEQTIDSVAVVSGDRVLVKDQSTGTENGVYVVDVGDWSRAADSIGAGMALFVAEGTTNGDTGWELSTNESIVVGTTSLTFGQFTSLGQITAGTALSKTGSTLNVDLGTIADSAAAGNDSRITGAVQSSLYDANSILAATTDNTPEVLTVGASTFVGRKATGNIAAMSTSEAMAMLTVVERPSFGYAGVVQVTTGRARYYVEEAVTVTAVRVSVDTAPTGATLIVDVNKNGTTIYTTQANRPAIAISGNTATANSPDVTALAAGDYLTVDIDQVGSTIAGADLTVQVELKH